jgi:hypothetical protein
MTVGTTGLALAELLLEQLISGINRGEHVGH